MRQGSAPHAGSPAAIAGEALFSRRVPAALPPDLPPLLAVVVDTEEEFDWGAEFSRAATGVTAMRAQERAQRLFARYGLVPHYAITYPVATQPDGYRPLQEFHANGACEIGAHLHPWVTPPFDEPVTSRNSLAGNLDPALERAKLAVLSEAIGARFGRPPILYKAGRYGLGPATEASLDALGFAIDASMLPGIDLRAQHGPDYRRIDPGPQWFGSGRRLLELPPTAGFSGLMGGTAWPGRLPATGPGIRPVRSLLARTRLAERITLTPEGVNHAAHRRLLLSLLRRGQLVFTLSYHSPSLAIGHTPYVRNAGDLVRFTDTIERTLDLFMGELGGRPTTPHAVLALAQRHAGLPHALAPEHHA